MNTLPVTSVPVRPLRTISLVTVQLALVLLVIKQFQLESHTFFNVMLIATVGFVVHALLPLDYRLYAFTFLSLGAVIVALGPSDGISLIVLGLILIGISHLPVRMAIRIVLLVATGMLFAAWRMELLPAPWSATIWPILASMFMFRLAIYIYSLMHDKKRPSIAQTLAYFFMLPNVCFPLYPVVDYSTFCRTYYDREAAWIYKVGVRWIVRGLFHLILYRLVYLHLAKDPADLRTLGDLVQFMVATFLLYLRVSGQFHVIGGVLHLYGFHLPRTHHLYYLASSFTDHWRRINIYWKDFMMKLVYYPSYFWLRRWGGNVALVVSTVIVFLATWILHSYQWFWLRGGFPLELQDILFWSTFCALVMFNTLREMKRSQKRKVSRSQAWSMSLAFRRVGTFTAICLIWTLWTSESVTSWLAMLTVAGNASSTDAWLLVGLVTSGLLIAGRTWSVQEAEDDKAVPFYRQLSLQSTAVLVVMLAIGNTVSYARYAPGLAGTVASLQHSTLNARDAALRHKGYYERLDNSSRMSAQLWDVQSKKPSHWVSLADTEAYRRRNDFILADLGPDVHITFEDQPLTTNRWSMRDRDRGLAKAEGTYRIALLGPSSVMGSGVSDNETISTFLEERLNAAPGTYKRYEVLNFGVAAYSLLQQFALLEGRGLAFQPDAVFIVDSVDLGPPVLGHLENVLLSQTPIPYPFLNALVREAGVESLANPGPPVPFESARAVLGSLGIKTRMPGREADRRLRPFQDAIVRWTFEQIAATTRQHGAVPVFVIINVVSDSSNLELPAVALKDAAAAGFIVFNLIDIWQNRDRAALQVAEWDEHANAAGNRVIAERLFDLIQQHKSPLGLTATEHANKGRP